VSIGFLGKIRESTNEFFYTGMDQFSYWASNLVQVVVLSYFHSLDFISTCVSLYNPLSRVVVSIDGSREIFFMISMLVSKMLLLPLGEYGLNEEELIERINSFTTQYIKNKGHSLIPT